MNQSINQKIAQELNVKTSQVDATVTLLDAGDTVPFIARYRKEVTGSLDDSQLRLLDERLSYLRELAERRDSIIKTIAEQDKLTDSLKQKLFEADTKTRLEDLYKPYKVKRETKAQIARNAGLDPLAQSLLNNPNLIPEREAEKYINKDKKILSINDALEGAKFILMEQFSENAELVGQLRDSLWADGFIVSKVVKGQEEAGTKFSDYFDTQEKVNKIPPHRILALLRGQKEGYLRLSIELNVEDDLKPQISTMEYKIAKFFAINLPSIDVNNSVKSQSVKGNTSSEWLIDVVKASWKNKIKSSLENDLKTHLKEDAENAAIDVFGDNLKDLLLAAPAGQKITIGLDPGLRTGVKTVVVDETGKLLEHATIYPHAPRKEWEKSLHVLATLAQKYSAQLVSIGNGTASRETDKLVADLIKQYPHLKLSKIVVSEAGASVYSASELASKEFPSLDVTLRGAVSIARRLQDPLSELVKIDPQAIGVGQYQHDVSQTKLMRKLDAIVEDCVNGVGVDLNTASVPLLEKIAGLNKTIANNIVDYREQHGAFKNRTQLKKVARLGDKAFEQSAGFLRVMNGNNPLDSSAVHPETYQVVKKIAQLQKRDIKQLIGDVAFLQSLNPGDYIDEKFGVLTISDIIKELEKPGRDPRPEFKTAEFKEGVEDPKDLKIDMVLQGVVTNVTNFGAFVDIGVHQDGLVHISALADKFVKDPRDIVKAGDVVKVKVVEIDLKRNRIALTMKLNEKTVADKPASRNNNKLQKKPVKQQVPNNSAMAMAFAQLKR